jgi:NADH-quinone oxidoreductase subunit E
MLTGKKTMLTQEEKNEIQGELAKYEAKRAAAPEALKIVQKYRGWISDDSLKEIADYLDMTSEEMESIATCYNLIFRKPVGRHVILICDSVACWVMGYEQIRDHLQKRLGVKLGETTADDKFTLLPVCCIGACDEAPAMILDGTMHGKLDVEKIDSILDKCA